ncbi:MAG: apolipoprotein N-acyltransferase [Porticoccaceae bacterium]
MIESPRALLASPLGPRLLALAAGALFPLALAPFGWSSLGILSMALLCALLRDGGPREVFIRALAFGLGQFGVGASWVYVSIHVYGEAPVPLAALLTGLFILLLALCLAVPFSLYGRVARRQPLAAVFVFPSLWVLAEWFRGWFLTGFPWLYLGNSQIDGWLAGWAPLGGVLALGWMAAFSGAALAQLGQLRDRAPGVIAGLLCAALPWLWGATLDDKRWTTPAEAPVRVALLQPALPLAQKWDQGALFQILDLYRRESETLWDNPLVIWPESAIPEVRHRVDHYLAWMDERAREAGSTLITGIPTQASNRYYNSVIALGDGSGQYDKRHLVPFGEYVPLERWLRGTIRFFDLPMSTFSGGAEGQPLLRAGKLHIATAICYEIVYQDLVARTTADADILLTVSNDTWFGSSIGPHQHFEMARLRALENGKPVLRATNDGITAIIDSRGQVRASLPQFQRAVLEGEVTPHSGTTPFTRFGSWPVVVLCLLMVAVGLRLGRTGLIAGRPTPDV